MIDVRNLYAMEKRPFFDPPGAGDGPSAAAAGGPDGIVRAFHNSAQCAQANGRLIGSGARRSRRPGTGSSRENPGRWPAGDTGQGAPPRFHDAHRAVRGASRARLQRLRRLRAQHRRAVDSQPRPGALFRARRLSGVRRLRGRCLDRLAVQHLGRVPHPDLGAHGLLPARRSARRRITTAGCRPCMRRTSATCSGSSSAPMPT